MNPSCLQTTAALTSFHPWSQMLPHSPFKNISTLPSVLPSPPASRTRGPENTITQSEVTVRLLYNAVYFMLPKRTVGYGAICKVKKRNHGLFTWESAFRHFSFRCSLHFLTYFAQIMLYNSESNENRIKWSCLGEMLLTKEKRTSQRSDKRVIVKTCCDSEMSAKGLWSSRLQTALWKFK